MDGPGKDACLDECRGEHSLKIISVAGWSRSSVEAPAHVTIAQPAALQLELRFFGDGIGCEVRYLPRPSRGYIVFVHTAATGNECITNRDTVRTAL